LHPKKSEGDKHRKVVPVSLFPLTLPAYSVIIVLAGSKRGEMAERLMALVLKVQHEPKRLDKSKVSPMFDIGFLLFWMSFDGKDVRKACHPMH